MIATTHSAAHKTKRAIASGSGKARYRKSAVTASEISARKWRNGIVAPHMMHRPRSPKYARLGMFAHHGIVRSQLSHRDPGDTIDSSRGSRHASTLTKLPTLAPTRNASVAPSPVGKSKVIGSPAF